MKDDKDYTDQEEPVVLQDAVTGEPYYRNVWGEKVWL